MKSGWLKRGLENAGQYVKSDPYLYARSIMSRIGEDICKISTPTNEYKIEFPGYNTFFEFIKHINDRQYIEKKEIICVKLNTKNFNELTMCSSFRFKNSQSGEYGTFIDLEDKELISFPIKTDKHLDYGEVVIEIKDNYYNHEEYKEPQI